MNKFYYFPWSYQAAPEYARLIIGVLQVINFMVSNVFSIDVYQRLNFVLLNYGFNIKKVVGPFSNCIVNNENSRIINEGEMNKKDEKDEKINDDDKDSNTDSKEEITKIKKNEKYKLSEKETHGCIINNEINKQINDRIRSINEEIELKIILGKNISKENNLKESLRDFITDECKKKYILNKPVFPTSTGTSTPDSRNSSDKKNRRNSFAEQFHF